MRVIAVERCRLQRYSSVRVKMWIEFLHNSLKSLIRKGSLSREWKAACATENYIVNRSTVFYTYPWPHHHHLCYSHDMSLYIISIKKKKKKNLNTFENLIYLPRLSARGCNDSGNGNNQKNYKAAHSQSKIRWTIFDTVWNDLLKLFCDRKCDVKTYHSICLGIRKWYLRNNVR